MNYLNWPELVNRFPEKPQVDCARCALGEFVHGQGGHCCDFQPLIVNHLAGSSAVMNRTFQGKSIEYFHLTPLGLVPRRFDRTPCVFLKNSLCGIYKVRPAECLSYFCHSAQEWREVSVLLNRLESGLAHLFLIEAGFEPFEADRWQIRLKGYLSSKGQQGLPGWEYRSNWPKAFEWYKRANEWVTKMGPAQRAEILTEVFASEGE